RRTIAANHRSGSEKKEPGRSNYNLNRPPLNKMTKTSLLLSAVSLFLSMTGVAGAQQTQGTLASILETKTIKLGHLDQSFPFSFADDKGKPAGYSVELCLKVVAAIEQQFGLQKLDVQWVPVTMANRFDMVISGKIDLECGISTNTLSRQKLVDFSLMTWLDG